MASMDDIVLGIDIGGTKVALGVAGRDRAVRHERRIPTEAGRGPGYTVGRLIDAARELLGESGGRLVGIGVSCGGPLDPATGVVLSPPNLLGWDELPLKAILEEAFHAPARVDNDANVAALAEHQLGAGRGTQDMVYVTVSTGIGGGVIVGGRLVHGVRGSAGEVGHMTILPGGPRCGCGNRGCLEALASGTAIARAARERLMEGQEAGPGEESPYPRVPASPRHPLLRLAGSVEAVTAEHVVAAAREGDPLARAVWDEAVHYLAIGLGNVVTALAPEALVVGGGVSLVGDLLFEPLRAEMAERVRLVPLDRVWIGPAALGGRSGLVGAVLLALDGAEAGAR